MRVHRIVTTHEFVSCTLLLVALTIAGCDDAVCPSGTTQRGDRCVLNSELGDAEVGTTDEQASMGSANTSAPAPANSGTGGDYSTRGGSGSGVPDGTNDGGASPSTAGTGSARPAGGVAGAQSNSAGGAEGAAGAGASSSGGTQAAGSSGSPGSGDHVDTNAGSDPCAGHASEVVCEQTTMRHCDSSGGSSSQETCTSSQLCQVGLKSGACAVCNPGTFRCTDVKLDRCTDDGQYENVDSCPSAALCNESAGMCTDMVCNPNAKSCSSDGTLKTCNGDGSAFVGSGEACGRDMCDARNGRCNRCTPGAKSCRGTSVATCSADGQAESEEMCSPRSECWTASCSGNACRESPTPASTRCEGSHYCDGSGACVDCTNDSHCSAMDDACNDGTCVDGTCRRIARDRGQTCRSGSGLCDLGTCHDVECFSASDCAGADARCTDGECASCGDRKVGPGEQCDIGAPKKSGDQLFTATYDEYSCDARTCTRHYIFTACSVDTLANISSECGDTGQCNGQMCFPRAGCNGEGSCRLDNGRSGTCYGNTCFLICSGSTDCPSNLACQPGSLGFICS